MGHLALGYIVGKATAKFLDIDVNLPLIFMLSVLPDADILFPFLIQHRGPTHSIIFALIIFTPLFVVYHKKATPYFAAFIQHFFIGDYIAGEAQMLWPITVHYYGTSLCMESLTNITLEWVLFLASTIFMLKAGDLAGFFKSYNSNLMLAIPIFTVLLPTFLGFPLVVPMLLIPPHLFYLLMFSISTIIQALELLRLTAPKNKDPS